MNYIVFYFELLAWYRFQDLLDCCLLFNIVISIKTLVLFIAVKSQFQGLLFVGWVI